MRIEYHLKINLFIIYSVSHETNKETPVFSQHANGLLLKMMTCFNKIALYALGRINVSRTNPIYAYIHLGWQ